MKELLLAFCAHFAKALNKLPDSRQRAPFYLLNAMGGQSRGAEAVSLTIRTRPCAISVVRRNLALDLGLQAVSLDAIPDILLVCVFKIKHESF